MLTEVCIGENVFSESVSGLGRPCTIQKLPDSEQVSNPSRLKTDDCLKTMDVLILSQGNHEKELLHEDPCCGVKKTVDTKNLPDSASDECGDLSEKMDSQHLFEYACQEDISSNDIHSTVAKLPISQHLLNPYSIKNDALPNFDETKGSGTDFCEGFSTINNIVKLSAPYQFSQINKDDVSKYVDDYDCSGADILNASSDIDLDCAVGMLSVSQKLSEPLAGGNDACPVSNTGEHILQGDTLVSVLKSVLIDEPFGQNQDGRTDSSYAGCDTEATRPETSDASPQRLSIPKTKSRKNSPIVDHMKNRRHASQKVSVGLELLQITRRRRSSSGKRARASVWGLLSNLERDFEKKGDVDITLIEHGRPNRSRRGKTSGKQGKNQSSNRLKKSSRKRSNMTGQISVKFKFGSAGGPASVIDAVNNIDGLSETIEKFADPSKEEEFAGNDVPHGCKENLLKIVTDSDDTIHAIGKNLDENKASSVVGPGTSPDSEVINLNVDACLAGSSQEVLHDIQNPSGGVSSSKPIHSKNGRNESMLHSGSGSPENELLNSGTMDSGQQFMDAGLLDKAVDGCYLTDPCPSVNTVNASANITSVEGISKDQISPRVAACGISCLPLKADIGLVVTPMACVESECSLLQISDKLHSRSKGEKIPRGTRMEGVRNSKEEVSANSKGHSSRKKVPRKQKPKVKLNGCLTPSETKIHTEAGDSKLSDPGVSGSGNSSLIEDVTTTDVDPRGTMEQFPKPRNAWVLCDKCQKWRRIPAILADQIEETKCTWTCMDNTNTLFSDCSIPQEKSNAEINAELDISDVSCDEGVCDADTNSNNLVKNQSIVPQKLAWTRIKSNQFLHRKRKTQTIDEVMVCHCNLPSDGRRGCGNGCLNRMLNIECIQRACPCGEFCSNHQFQKRKYAKLKMFRCGKKGHGLQVLENITEGQFLIEYVGEVLDMHAYEARQRDYAQQGHRHFYFMTLNGSEVIDACAKGNLGRFINHSCDPNCRTEKWMVNGEVCIGIFALRNIKVGEELTFDYNYVRVSGAAAKKCVCGSSQCRGYIGGDPQNAEIIVQDDSDDEYIEPVMIPEDALVDESNNSMTSTRIEFGSETMTDEKEPLKDESSIIMKPSGFAICDQPVETQVPLEVVGNRLDPVVKHVKIIEECNDSFNTSESTTRQLDISSETDSLTEPLETAASPDAVLKPDDSSDKNTSTVISKLLPDIRDSKRKAKSDTREGIVKPAKSHPVMKSSRSSSLVKKEKLKSSPVNAQRGRQMQSKYFISGKARKVEVSSTSRFEAVQETLNDLLNPDGGISKHKDASRGYLKLLLLTAASGDSYNGEAIQSNRDLSMILDALLKTKSRTVLVDIMNKNGLQMLHNMLKRSRKEFNKIPILRKLLKVFEYLATRAILTSEHINSRPTCLGVESFSESILSLTEHIDKQVHQITRNFRDKWIPRAARRHNIVDREDSKMDFHRGMDHSRFSAQKNWSDPPGTHLETPDCIPKSVVRPNTIDVSTVDGSGQPCSSGTKIRKRKSRWDQPGDPNLAVDNRMTREWTNSSEDDRPPGFASPHNPPVAVQSEAHLSSSHRNPIGELIKTVDVVVGQPQERFISHSPVSYGVPFSLVMQAGTPVTEMLEGWSVSPGMPFHPFPPLPPYSRAERYSTSKVVGNAVMGQAADVIKYNQRISVARNSFPNDSSSSPVMIPDVEMLGADTRPGLQQTRGPNTMGNNYFQQQKFNNSKHGPPWIRSSD